MDCTNPGEIQQKNAVAVLRKLSGLARQHFRLFFVRMDLQAHLHILFLSGSFEHTAYRRGSEAVAAYQHRDILPVQNQFEPQPLGPELGDFQLRLLGLVYQLHSHELKKIP